MTGEILQPVSVQYLATTGRSCRLESGLRSSTFPRVGMRRNVVRKEQARAELVRLQRDTVTWTEMRRAADPGGQHASQLTVLESVLQRGVCISGRELDAVADDADSGSVYARARETEDRAVFLRRYWEYFREKFDQRDGEGELARAMRSADEVVWSCWAPVFAAAGEDSPKSPPLPYVEPFFSPRAIVRETPPSDLRHRDGPLRRAVADLPIPVIGLPPVCVARPWWLIFIAHETGHHLQRELFAGELPAAFAEVLDAVVVDGPPVWADWQDELFADAVAVLLCGSAAAWAAAELLEGPPDAMATEGDGYPPAIVRQAFMAVTLETVGVAPAACVPPLQTAATLPGGLKGARIRMLLDDVAAVARAAVTTVLRDGATLSDLCLPDAAALRVGGEVDWWRERYAEGEEPLPSTRPEAARRSLAGAVAAWRELAAQEDDDGGVRRAEALRKVVVTTLAACRPDGQRDIAPALDVRAAASALEAVLLSDEPLV